MNKILFSEQLRERRKNCGYDTINDLARKYNETFPSERKNKKAENSGDYSGILGTLKNYENPNKKCNPRLDIVDNLCKLLSCNVDHLLGNIECKTHDVQFIQDCTGLSENSIENICTINKSNKSNEYMTALNMLLQQDYDLRRILLHINKYIKATNEYKSIHKMVLDRYNEVLSGEPMDIDGFYNWPYNDDLDKDCTASKREMSVEEYELYNTIISVIKGLAKTNVQ